MRACLLFASMALAGCGAAPANESVESEHPTNESAANEGTAEEAQPVTTPPSSTPRRARATRGAAIIDLADTPGFLVDGNAPPPPPGSPPARHAAITASCIGDVAGCSEAGPIVRGATSFDAAIEGLRGIGFEVVITP